ncbi:MAG: hypothetical protein ABI831_04295 [Betaproteobacteria bacterium]
MTTTMIGGEVCRQRLASQLLPAEPRALTRAEIDGLWRIFVAIGTVWKNTVHDSAGLKSSWLEFLTEKTRIQPSYVAEYVNALVVVEELILMYKTKAFEKLFLDNGIPLDSRGVLGRLDTRLAHAKHFVADEFIRVQVVAGGFKNFIRPHQTEIRPENIVNYNGFIAGSRFSRIKPVRPYEEPSE